MSDATPERGGKGRRYVKLEAEGAMALRDARRVAERCEWARPRAAVSACSRRRRWRAGARLVTENVGDYPAGQRHLRGFRFVAAVEVVG